MCIIVLKPVGVALPEIDTLKYCWDKNDDGAGYAFWIPDKKVWRVRKGFMKWDEFVKDYKANHFNAQDCVISHYRIGTSGLKDGGNTHPFPIVDDMEKMRDLEFDAEAIAFHNGTVGNGSARFSDTMEHVKDYLFPLMAIWEDERVNTKIADAVLTKNSSRWLVCTGRYYHKFGTWYEKGGVFFSNSNYEPVSYVNPTTGGMTNGAWRGADGTIHYPIGVAPRNDPDYEKAKKEYGLPLGSDWGHGYHRGAYGFWRDNKFYSWKEYMDLRGLLPAHTNVVVPISTHSGYNARQVWNSKTGKWEDAATFPLASQGNPAKSTLDHMETVVSSSLNIDNEKDFLDRYLSTYTTEGRVPVRVMNWRKFSEDQRMIRIIRKRKQQKEHAAEVDKAAREFDVDKKDIVTGMVDDDGSLAWDMNKKKADTYEQDVKDLGMCPGCFDSDHLEDSPFTEGSHICTNCGCVFTLATGYIHLYDPDIHRAFQYKKMSD